MQGALNVAAFEEAYEDRDNVYIVTELCRGGELWHRIGEKHYSERTVRNSFLKDCPHPSLQDHL